jgi:hypothetical protein
MGDGGDPGNTMGDHQMRVVGVMSNGDRVTDRRLGVRTHSCRNWVTPLGNHDRGGK